MNMFIVVILQGSFVSSGGRGWGGGKGGVG